MKLQAIFFVLCICIDKNVLGSAAKSKSNKDLMAAAMDNEISALEMNALDSGKLRADTTFDFSLEFCRKTGKAQKVIDKKVPFACDVKFGKRNTSFVPTSVHALRPGDIDVIAAIGDSLTAGNGALAVTVRQVMEDEQSVSWSIGGQKDWRNFLTLPNILKEFNPNLYGYSTETFGHVSVDSPKFNLAVPGSVIEDMDEQAGNLILALIKDPKVNFKKNWKLITFMVGGNDMCLEMCYSKNPEKAIETRGNTIKKALKMMKESLPRTLVNLVLPIDVSFLARMSDRSKECQSLHLIECPCLFKPDQIANREKMGKIIDGLQKRIEEIALLPEFHDDEDFDITVHKFLMDSDCPLNDKKKTDYSYLSTDCFHLSQLGHARASNSYWNSMMTPENKRQKQWSEEFEEFKCPTLKNPYIYTSKNSK